MKSSVSSMSTCLKQRVAIKLLLVDNVNCSDIYRLLKVVYSDETVDQNTVNR